jgi:hydroxyethylthiazole kinase
MVAGGGVRLVWAERVPALAGLIGAGDVLTAVIAACRAAEADGPVAAWSGLAIFTAAARVAAARAAGPGSFWPALVDALQAVTPAEVAS